MLPNYIIIFACVLTVYSSELPENKAPIISTYAKVAHWGAVSSSTTEKPQSQGRSHNGQTLWTHRSEANIIQSQNLKTVKPKVVYHYAQKVSQGQKEANLGVGEVQERFNPRPYFDYTHVPSKSTKTDSKKTKVDATPSPTFDSFPVFQAPAAPSVDLYSSQYSSYNPPNAGPVGPVDDSKPDVAYPPNAPPPPEDTNNNSDGSNNGYSYNPPNDTPPAPEGPPAYPTLGPPLSPNHHDHKEQIYYPPSDEDDHKGHVYHPPSDDHDHKEQLYYPPSGNNGHHETILDHPPPGWQESNSDGDMNDHDMNGHDTNGQAMNGNGMNGNGHDMAEHDLSPPPSPNLEGQFPHYLYNGPSGQGHDFDYDFDHHHVYKEVTTTEAPEDERVNKGHYSYYYLGRKLWYIPLYFSVYFILYVTVLILKSIARHKIQLKHEHFTRDQGKDMSKDMGHGRALNLEELHENVTTAIDTSRRKFAYVAM